jgi:hypothetical protein
MAGNRHRPKQFGWQKLGEVKHLSTLWKRKRNVIPLVAASECGTAQTADFSAGFVGPV